jgi:competence protein ComEA
LPFSDGLGLIIDGMEMPEISRRRALVYVGVLLAVLALAGRFVVGGAQGGDGGHARPAAGLEVEPQAPAEVVVHVAGAVHRPGLYRLREGSRVDDAIRLAGGSKPKAALELVNLAAPVADGQQVLVPARGSATAAAASPGAAGGAAGLPGGRVHLNSATLEQLDTLPGIGPVTAQKILDYRAKKGAFSSVDELDAVPGIGAARLEQLRDLVDL